MSNGWIGPLGQLRHAVRTVGGDCDPDSGKPIVDGVMLYLGIDSDNNDAVVSAESVYYVDGQPVKLAPLLNATSYGVRNVEVF